MAESSQVSEVAGTEETSSPKLESRNPARKKNGKNKQVSKKEEKEAKKNERMRTALDVIKRLKWDENLSEEFFTIGYIDRFKGVVEDPFTKFSHWGDLVNADHDVDLAIPQHRIVYFKYKDTKVWDKEHRLDLVFNSTVFQGDFSGKTIEEVMTEVDDRIVRQRDEGPDSEPEQQGESSDSSDDSDSDDDDFEVNISTDATKVDVSMFKQIPMEERSTHFVAIKITEKEIVDNAILVQRHIVKQEEELGDCVMGSGLFHMTLAMMRLNGIEGAEEATSIINELQEDLKELLERNKGRNQGFKLSGLDTFGQRVLYAKVVPEENAFFWEFVGIVLDRFSKSSSHITLTNKFDLAPHVTLLKVNRPISKVRKSKFLPSRLYEDYNDMYFGVQPMNNLQLCVIEATTRNDGFYRTLAEVKFP